MGELKANRTFKSCVLYGAVFGLVWGGFSLLVAIFIKEIFLGSVILKPMYLILAIIDALFVNTGLVSMHDAINIFILCFIMTITLGILIGITWWLMMRLFGRGKSRLWLTVILLVCGAVFAFYSLDRLMLEHKAEKALEAKIGEEANEYHIDSCKKDNDRTLVTFVGDTSVLGDHYLVVLNKDGTSTVFEGE